MTILAPQRRNTPEQPGKTPSWLDRLRDAETDLEAAGLRERIVSVSTQYRCTRCRLGLVNHIAALTHSTTTAHLVVEEMTTVTHIGDPFESDAVAARSESGRGHR